MCLGLVILQGSRRARLFHDPQSNQAQSLSSSQTTSRDATPTQQTETIYPYNVNIKFPFPKVASSHSRYSIFTLHPYHHPEPRCRSWHTQMTSPSHLHTQAHVQPRHSYKHTYIMFCLDKTICTLFTPDHAECISNLYLKINNTALQMATHPKMLVFYVLP